MIFRTEAFVDHAAYFVKDTDFDTHFFTEVLGFTVREIRGEKPAQRVFLNGGIQLIQDTDAAERDPLDGHLGIICEDREEVLKRAAKMNIEVLPKGSNWLRLPDGLILEILQAKPGSVERYGQIEVR